MKGKGGSYSHVSRNSINPADLNIYATAVRELRTLDLDISANERCFEGASTDEAPKGLET